MHAATLLPFVTTAQIFEGRYNGLTPVDEPFQVIVCKIVAARYDSQSWDVWMERVVKSDFAFQLPCPLRFARVAIEGMLELATTLP
ncbi:MAG TPA: hypothetical protein VJA27_02180 [Patescibacteria group bacterium]|nr:hypothetical protein [Patescibacteria group bacterium]